MGQDVYDRVSRGEAVSFPDFPSPIQDVKDRGVIDDKPYKALTMDLFFQPVWDGDTYVCTMMYVVLAGNMAHPVALDRAAGCVLHRPLYVHRPRRRAGGGSGRRHDDHPAACA